MCPYHGNFPASDFNLSATSVGHKSAWARYKVLDNPKAKNHDARWCKVSCLWILLHRRLMNRPKATFQHLDVVSAMDAENGMPSSGRNSTLVNHRAGQTSSFFQLPSARALDLPLLTDATVQQHHFSVTVSVFSTSARLLTNTVRSSTKALT